MSAANLIRVFNGAVAIITGGASGIGKAFGEALAERGCEVVLADIQAEPAEETAAGIRAAGGKAAAARVDVTRHENVAKLVEETVERCGRLDYMFNNAGIVLFGEAGEYRMEDWQKSIDVNLRGVIHGVDAAYRVMRRQGFGHIVNTASIAGLMPWPMEIGYTTTKHAVVGLSTALRAEAGPAGIRVSVLCPGLVRTPIIYGGKYGGWIRPRPEDKMKRLMDSMRPLPVDRFVQVALKQIERNKAIIVVPFFYRALWWMYRLWPPLGVGFARMVYREMQRQLGSGES